MRKTKVWVLTALLLTLVRVRNVMMEKKHLIHHIWSQRGYELYMLILLTQTSFNFYCLAEEEQAEFSSGSHIICNCSQIPATQLLLLGGCQRQKTQLDIQIPDWVLLCWQLDKPAFDLYVNRANLNWKVIKRKHILHNIHCTVAFPTFPILTFLKQDFVFSSWLFQWQFLVLLKSMTEPQWFWWDQKVALRKERQTSKILQLQFYHLCGKIVLL